MTTLSVVSMPKQSGFNSSKGRKPRYNKAMIGKSVSMPGNFWDHVEEEAETEREETGREISGSEIVRRAVEAWIERPVTPRPAGHIIPMKGVILGDDFEKIQLAPASASIEVPNSIGKECYAILVLGKPIETDDGMSIPSGHYAIFCPQEKITPGALVDVAWDGEDSKSSPAFKKYVPRPDGAIFKPVASTPAQQDIAKKTGEFKIRGSFVDTWAGSNTETAQ